MGLSSNIGTVSRNLRNVGHIVFEGTSTKSKAARVTVGGTPAHGKWSYGSSHASGELAASPGAGIIPPCCIGSNSTAKCTAQVKDDTLSGGQDSVFAVTDGNGSPDVSDVLQTLLSSTLSEELRQSSHEKELLYLEHTFLALHR